MSIVAVLPPYALSFWQSAVYPHVF